MTDGLLAGRYQLGEVLGSGGVAEVRIATDVLLCRDVAVKLFRTGHDTADPRRFDNEIRTLAQLSHPGLVSVYDADATGPTPYMVLELVKGPTLRERIDDGPMPVAEVRRLGRALADALAHVHAQGFIHRDVKPSNVLLDDEGMPRLADFGLVWQTGGVCLTRTDVILGTAAYLAPEQVRGGEITAAVDVYALGLVLLECLTGRREYEGAEIESAVARLHRPPVVPDDVPFDLARLLSLMTALPAGRRPSARECADALAAADPPTLVAPVPTLSRRVPAPVSARSRRALAAAAVVVAAAIGTALVARDHTPPPNQESAPPATTTAPASTQQRTVDQLPVVAQQTATQVPVVAEDRSGPADGDKHGKNKGKGGDKSKGKGG